MIWLLKVNEMLVISINMLVKAVKVEDHFILLKET